MYRGLLKSSERFIISEHTSAASSDTGQTRYTSKNRQTQNAI